MSFDVAVVGAGVVGSAIAYECARRGASVVLVERDEPGSHASGAAAGMLAPCSEAHEAGPFLDMARESLALWPGFAAQVAEDGGADPELHLDGLLRVALSEDDAETVQARLAWQQQAGITDATWLDAAQAVEIEPALQHDVAGAAYYPGEGHVHSRRAVQALVKAAAARGAEIRSGGEVSGPTPRGLALSGASGIEARTVILAAGAWLGKLAARFGGALHVEPVHGQLLALTGLPHPPRRVLYAGHDGYVVAKRDGTVLVGATEEHRGYDTTPSDAVAHQLRGKAERLLQGVEHATAETHWTGLRPAAPDHLPLLGPLPGRDDTRVLVAGGHYRNGVLLAPATARGMADLALDGRAPQGWHPFDPRRLA